MFSRAAPALLRASVPARTVAPQAPRLSIVRPATQALASRNFATEAKEVDKSLTVDQAKLEKLSQEVLSLNLMEVIQFVNIMEKKLGLGDVRAMMASAASAPAAGGAGSGGAGKDAGKKDAAPAAPTKTIFELKLEAFEAGDKIKVIKTVREITGLGLKEAKDIVEGVPKVLLKDVTKEQGTQLVEKLKASGAKASLV